jgi:hypothetical protein
MSGRGQTTTTAYPLAQQRRSEHYSSQSGLIIDNAPTHAPVFQTQGEPSSSNHVPPGNGQEQKNPGQKAIQYNMQNVRWSSQPEVAMLEEGGVDLRGPTDAFASTSQYQTQHWSSSHPRHLSNPTTFLTTSDTYSTQRRESDSVSSSNQTLEMELEAAGYGYNRQMVEEFSGNPHDVQTPNSGALNLTHVDDPWPFTSEP